MLKDRIKKYREAGVKSVGVNILGADDYMQERALHLRCLFFTPIKVYDRGSMPYTM